MSLGYTNKRYNNSSIFLLEKDYGTDFFSNCNFCPWHVLWKKFQMFIAVNGNVEMKLLQNKVIIAYAGKRYVYVERNLVSLVLA